MALMERVATLLRANVNELVTRAQDPEAMLKQFVLDLENQLLQVKTQVAMSLAHQHVLERKREEQQRAVGDWHRKAELAVSKGDDVLARAVLERALGYEKTLPPSRRSWRTRPPRPRHCARPTTNFRSSWWKRRPDASC